MITEKDLLITLFTFHHVSIKTVQKVLPLLNVMYSHSTMYLLKRYKQDEIVALKKTFTFHHVSIKTTAQRQLHQTPSTFTFHHVSIKTLTQCVTIPLLYYSHSTMYLLKPTTADGLHNFVRIHNPPCIY